ncbi:hypothetical protein [Bacillus pseudomycoides]|uniref:hypothetical protein n=2 Tax=Bacillaceae TaxID=186817 RepID=UPI0001A13ECF|nr:hypothetical protein [Bacillus pseudomycoides]EEM01862.1 hypothetical protein bmyco0002_58160 [Bacillus pseudomycoides]
MMSIKKFFSIIVMATVFSGFSLLGNADTTPQYLISQSNADDIPIFYNDVIPPPR